MKTPKQLPHTLLNAFCTLLFLSLFLAPATAQEPDPVVRITMWSVANPTDNSNPTREAIDRFNEAHIGQVQFDVTYLPGDGAFITPLEIAIVNGTPPDVFQTWGGRQLLDFVNDGVVREIAPLRAYPNNRYTERHDETKTNATKTETNPDTHGQ